MNENATPPPPPPSQPPPAPEPPPSGGGGTTSSNRSIMIVLSYLWLLALIPLLVEKDDREVQWHAKHGLVMLGVEILLFIAVTIVGNFFACLGCAVGPLISLAFLVVRVIAIVKGLNGERFTLPVITDLVGKI